MISDHDRSGWFGASDTAVIMGNWNTKTFARWWMVKLGLEQSHFVNVAMLAGTYFEHPILRAVGAAEMDRQLLVPELRLRVNLDGNTGSHIMEVKTYKLETTPFAQGNITPQSASLTAPLKGSRAWKPTKAYLQQVQVQMLGAERCGWKDVSAEIVAYGLVEEDYKNFFREIDPRRLKRFPVEADPGFRERYLQRVRYLAGCLEAGVWPGAFTPQLPAAAAPLQGSLLGVVK